MRGAALHNRIKNAKLAKERPKKAITIGSDWYQTPKIPNNGLLAIPTNGARIKTDVKPIRLNRYLEFIKLRAYLSYRINQKRKINVMKTISLALLASAFLVSAALAQSVAPNVTATQAATQSDAINETAKQMTKPKEDTSKKQEDMSKESEKSSKKETSKASDD